MFNIIILFYSQLCLLFQFFLHIAYVLISTVKCLRVIFIYLCINFIIELHPACMSVTD